MYTQSFSVPDDTDGKASRMKAAPKPPSEHEVALQAAFDERIDADGRIEPRDWMPEAYRKTWCGRSASTRIPSSACCPRATDRRAPSLKASAS